MFWNLLTATEESSSAAAATTGCNTFSFLPWILILGAVILMYFFSKRAQKKQQDQIDATLNAIQPGNKVKTIGGICGVVVELCPEDNTFILETGSETTGKSYIKFDKKAVYQTDAVPAAPEQPLPEQAEEAVEAEKHAPEFDVFPETTAATEVSTEQTEETPVEEAPVEEVPAEETPVEEVPAEETPAETDGE